MTGFSLHIGLNRVSAAHYGSDNPLKNAVADAQAMAAIARSGGYQVAILTDANATVGNFAVALHGLADKAVDGDIVFLSYAGHGSNLFDASGDESDSLDETWCLYDRMIVDDELYGLYTLFRPGVRLLIVSDSCHSATVARIVAGDQPDRPFDPDPERGEFLRGIDEAQGRAIYRANSQLYDSASALAQAGARGDLRCALQLFAACQDDQLAGDGIGNGFFTTKLLARWDNGSWTGSYTELFDALTTDMPRRQKPNRQVLGENTDAFLAQRPFTI